MTEQKDHGAWPFCAKCDKKVDEVSVDNQLRRARGRSILDREERYESTGQSWTVRCHGQTATRSFTEAEVVRGLAFPLRFFEPDADKVSAAYTAAPDNFLQKPLIPWPETVVPEGTPIDAPPPGHGFAGTLEARPTVNIVTSHFATLPDGSTVNLPAGTVLREGVSWGGGPPADPLRDLCDAFRADPSPALATMILKLREQVDRGASPLLEQARALLQRARPWIAPGVPDVVNAAVEAQPAATIGQLRAEIDAFLAGLPVTSTAPTFEPTVEEVAAYAVLAEVAGKSAREAILFLAQRVYAAELRSRAPVGPAARCTCRWTQPTFGEASQRYGDDPACLVHHPR